ncbi:MAG: dTDP-4-amino-4,6-dideoxygalactose transaminase [Kiritimatiellia bacterium]|nr:dTDP-4-amino-4,6-dideoxygalactose transaminase [Kiritimatiellia bacterium]
MSTVKVHYKIPFNRPCFAGNEQKYIAEAIAAGQISGDGKFTGKCHAWLERELGVKRAFLTTSCTHAIEMAAILLNIKPGDEVILPAFTFVSTANAFVLRGAKPVFADIRPDTLNIDERKIAHLITRRTKAVCVVHYAGVGCEMDAILKTAKKHGLAVIEDNAHGLFGCYKGKPLGTFGCLAAQSFHETKNITCGEGGALLINDSKFIERAEIIREKGTNRSQVFRGQADKYTWIDVGSSYLPSDILAACLWAQLEARAKIQKSRRRIWNYYRLNLKGWAAKENVRLPVIPSHCAQPCHMFYLLMPSLKDRQALIERLKAKSILAVFHYLPLHLSPMGRRFGGKKGGCPVAEDVSDRIVRLPFYNSLSRADQDKIIETIVGYQCV